AAALFLWVADSERSEAWGVWKWFGVGATLVAAAIGARYADPAARPGSSALVQSRSFFGVLTVWERGVGDPNLHRRVLQHGSTRHGMQYQSPELRDRPTTYYDEESGLGRAIRNLGDAPRRVGVIGLGVGTIASYGRRGDTIRFYEIDAEVERIARRQFDYLDRSAAEVEVVIGDGRLSLEREPDQRFDLLALDAFSSDAIPVHLLTREAFEIYLRHVVPDGWIAVHVSNRVIDLRPVIRRVAESLDLVAATIFRRSDVERGVLASTWVLVRRATNRRDDSEIRAAAEANEPPANTTLWTDERVNLLEILK
ncbi:MAG: fused MFS/spermidine synthase, partial [Planctomycetes bacterium]|nr:fused MFS/spermidine synthase [Planctomycetota bacterium]